MRTRLRPGTSHRSRSTARTGPTRIRPALAGLLAATLLLAACSGGGDDTVSGASPSASSSPTGSSPSASSDATPSSSGSSPAASDTSSAAAPEGSLASKTFTVTSTYSQLPIRIRFDLLALQRRGDLLQVDARVTNTDTDRTKDMRWQVSNRFDPPVYREDLGASNGIFGGVVLTDVAGKKRYLVAADSAKDCVCTTNLSGTFLGAGQGVDVVATYAAPPTSTTKLDVEVPSLGLFRDIAIS